MSFDISSARDAISKGEIKIQKGEGITHALMRFSDSENSSKGVKDLEKAFRALNTAQKQDIMNLAKEVGNNAPFSGRKVNNKYGVTDIAKVDETLRIGAAAQAPAAANKTDVMRFQGKVAISGITPTPEVSIDSSAIYIMVQNKAKNEGFIRVPKANIDSQTALVYPDVLLNGKVGSLTINPAVSNEKLSLKMIFVEKPVIPAASGGLHRDRADGA